MGGMSQPAYLVGAKVSPNQLIWSLEHIRCPKFGRGAPRPPTKLSDFLFFDGFPNSISKFYIFWLESLSWMFSYEIEMQSFDQNVSLL